MSEQTPLTFGQQSVGIKFNPGSDSAVDDIKTRFAKLIDDVKDFHNKSEGGMSDPYLTNTIKGEAIRTLMDAQMWAIKYITWKP